MLKRMMNKLFLSCFRATELMEKKLHFRLSFGEKNSLRMHKMMCDACRRYENQNFFIENSLKHKQAKPVQEDDIDQLKKSITNRLG